VMPARRQRRVSQFEAGLVEVLSPGHDFGANANRIVAILWIPLFRDFLGRSCDEEKGRGLMLNICYSPSRQRSGLPTCRCGFRHAVCSLLRWRSVRWCPTLPGLNRRRRLARETAGSRRSAEPTRQ
jgi:hypothetical protein